MGTSYPSPMIPHQRRMCSGFVMASKTRSRGASKSRVSAISRSDGVLTLNVPLFAAVLTDMSLLLCLQVAQIHIEAIEASFPQRAVPLGPLGDLLQRRRVDSARTPLSV